MSHYLDMRSRVIKQCMVAATAYQDILPFLSEVQREIIRWEAPALLQEQAPHK